MKKINGKIGLVLFVDALTQKEVNQLSLRYKNNRIIFGGKKGCVPHVTLFQANVKELPVSFAKNLLVEIASKIPMSISMSHIYFFGGHFVFWETKKSKELVLLHKKALKLSDYFDAEGEQQSDREDLSLSKTQIKNVNNFGYPFVQRAWRPHITLGYLDEVPATSNSSKDFSTEIQGVALVEVGECGTVGKIILLQKCI